MLFTVGLSAAVSHNREAALSLPSSCMTREQETDVQKLWEQTKFISVGVAGGVLATVISIVGTLNAVYNLFLRDRGTENVRVIQGFRKRERRQWRLGPTDGSRDNDDDNSDDHPAFVTLLRLPS